MHVRNGDLFDFYSSYSAPDAVCVTTNGFVKRDGRNVMGAGVALGAVKLCPGCDLKLGRLISWNGHVVQPFDTYRGIALVSFPTKYATRNSAYLLPRYRNRFAQGQVPGWACYSDLRLIEQSVTQLIKVTDTHEWKHVWLPRPGCNNGGLKWEDVKAVLDVLDNRFTMIIGG